MIEVIEITDLAQLAGYAQQWNEVVAKSAYGDFFQTYDWLVAWLENFWPSKPILLLLIRRDSHLIGAAPLLVDQPGEICCANTWVLPINPHTPRIDLPQAEEAETVLRAVLSHLRQKGRGIKICLPRLEDDTATKRALPAIGREFHLSTVQKNAERAPLIRIRSDHETYFKSLDSKVRHNVERKRRKLESSGALSWRTVTTPEQFADALEDLRQIERNSWKEDAGSSMTAEPQAESFYTQLARSCAVNGWLRLYLMCLDGRPIAYLYGVVYKKILYALKTSYDQEFHHLSPGSVLIDQITRDAFADQLSAVDFLGVETVWKKQLSNDVRTRSNVCLFSAGNLRCWSCLLYEQRLKPYVKNCLPYAIQLRRQLIAYLRRRGWMKN